MKRKQLLNLVMKYIIRNTIPVFLVLIQFSVGYGQVFQFNDASIDSTSQSVLDTIRNLQKRTSDIFGEQVTLYELGDSLATCETNFRNLLNNWHTVNVTNAEDYEFLEFSFVETVEDSTKYNYYRNYFSGEKPVFCSIQRSGGIRQNGEKFSERYVKPCHIHREFYDQINLPEEERKLLTKDFIQMIQAVFEKPFCVDTMKLNLYSFSSYQKDTTFHIDPGGFISSGINWRSSVWNVASPDSLSQDYFDVFVMHEKEITEFNVADAQFLILQNLMAQRILSQMIFTQQVHIGDRVVSVKFNYKGSTYRVYVICNPVSKKVVMDTFFQSVTVPKNT